jgi:hypothetical protein
MHTRGREEMTGRNFEKHNFISFELLTAGVPYMISKDDAVIFSDFDFSRMVKAYKKDKKDHWDKDGVFHSKEQENVRSAPIVIGHPEQDAPAFGSIDCLGVTANKLVGYTYDVPDSIRMGIREGKYPRNAAQFFGPENPSNPTPGFWFLKHVGLKGPVPREVRGHLTTDAEFMESLSGRGRSIDFSEQMGGNGFAEFCEFSTKPLNTNDLGQRASALMSLYEKEGVSVSATELVKKLEAIYGRL